MLEQTQKEVKITIVAVIPITNMVDAEIEQWLEHLRQWGEAEVVDLDITEPEEDRYEKLARELMSHETD